MSIFEPAVQSLPLIHQGKTRDTFKLPDPSLRLIVATDRLSTHNLVHHSEIPGKGAVLNALSVFWFTTILREKRIPNHLVAFGSDIYSWLPGGQGNYPQDLHHRAMVVENLNMLPVEFIFRSYLAGSLYSEQYVKGVDDYGLDLPKGLLRMHSFHAPLFTPTDKSKTDRPLNTVLVRHNYPSAHTLALKTFLELQSYLRLRGIELVDSKFELGIRADGEIVLGDEVVTPDSSRFVDPRKIVLGKNPPWCDKQIARDYAELYWGTNDPHPLVLPSLVIQNLKRTYHDVFFQAVGMTLEEFQTSVLS